MDITRPISFERIKNNFIRLSQKCIFHTKMGKKTKEVSFPSNRKFLLLAKSLFIEYGIPKKDHKKYILSIDGQKIPFENFIPFDGINDIIEIVRASSISMY